MEDKNKPRNYYVDEWKVEPIAPFGDLEPKSVGYPVKKPRTKVCPQGAVEEMRAAINRASGGSIDYFNEKFNPGASKEHLLEMLDKLESGEVDGDKAHRWLGYIQGVLVATRNGTIEDFGGVNKRSKR